MIDEKLIENLSNLAQDDIEDLSDEIFTLITEKKIELNQEEKAALLHFAKGHHSKNTLSNALNVVQKVDPIFIEKISQKYSKIEIKPKLEKAKKLDKLSNELLNKTSELSTTIKEDLVEDMLSILSQAELEKLNLTMNEKTDIFQLIKGHYNPVTLFNSLQVLIRYLEEVKWLPDSLPFKKSPRDIRFGVELVPAMGLDKLVKYTKQFEVGGMDNIWITDHYTNMDPYVTLTLVAKATKAINLGVGVTNPYIRHIASTASTIASLDFVSDGRMVLGIGAGDKSTLAALNIKSEKALTRVNETVQAIKLLWKNSNVSYNGEIIKLQNANLNFKPKRDIPIYVGAQGPKMLQLAGEIGDGILINASHELDFQAAGKQIEIGLNKANKTKKDVDVVAYTSFSVGDSEIDAKKATAPVVAFIAAATPVNVLERHDLNIDKASKMKEFLSKGDMGKAFKLVDDSFIEAFSLSGTPQQCINKIESLKNAGVTQFVFGSPLGPKKGKAIELINESILKSF